MSAAVHWTASYGQPWDVLDDGTSIYGDGDGVNLCSGM